MRSIFPRAAIAALLLAAAPPAPARPAPRAAHPALWVVADADTTIYLFGTIHALPPGTAWEPPALREAIGKADRLVLEAVVDKDPAATAAVIARIGVSPGLPPLAERLPPADRPRLAAMAKKSGYPPAALDALETWTAALTLAGVTIGALGVTSEAGVEEQLKAQFAAAGKPIEGLETVEGQLGFFDTLPEAAQRAFLADVVEEKGDDRTEFADMLGAWSRGDEKAIARSFDKDMKTSPGLRDALITRRNANWTAELRRLATPGTILVAVGAGHLAGRDSVIAMLERQGLKVRRVE